MAPRSTDLIRQVEMADKVSFKWHVLEPSTFPAARKRLAMGSRSERRPIMVFDEWAADQDPISGAFYTKSLIPALRASGRPSSP